MKQNNLPKWAWPLIALAVLLLYNFFFTPGFFSIEVKSGHLYGSLIDVLNRASPTMLVALGMTLVIATGGVDLSVGAVIAIAGAVAASIATKGNPSMPMLLLTTLGLASLSGLWNGVLVAYLGVQPMVATLILMVSGRGLAQLLTNGQIVTFTDPGLSFFGEGFLFGMPFSLTLVVGLLILLTVLTRQTAMGLFIESVGDSPTASRHAGIDVRGTKLFVYTVVAFCAGIAGLVVCAQTKAADSNNAGLYLELDAILAVVLGGTPLTGGRMSLVGSIFGALLIQALTTTILTKGVQVEWTLVVKALAVLAVCLIQSPEFRAQFARKKVAA